MKTPRQTPAAIRSVPDGRRKGDAPLVAHAVGVTHVGHVRASNEDAFVLRSLDEWSAVRRIEHATEQRGSRLLLAVADGMGGAAAGEVASAVTLASFCRALPNDSPDWDATLKHATVVANADVRAAARVPGRNGMGSTLTAACVHDGVVDVAQVGDSRAYVFRGGKLRQLTRDQTYVQRLIDEGHMTPLQAARSSMRNVLDAAIGGRVETRAVTTRDRLEAGDLLVLCSDGLTSELCDAEIAAILALTPSTAAAVKLVEATLESGARDNVTVVVARIDED